MFIERYFGQERYPYKKLKEFFLSEKTRHTLDASVVEYTFHVTVKTEDNKTSLLWELPVNIIPKKERYLFEKTVKQINPAISMNLVKAQFVC